MWKDVEHVDNDITYTLKYSNSSSAPSFGTLKNYFNAPYCPNASNQLTDTLKSQAKVIFVTGNITYSYDWNGIQGLR